MQIRWCTVFLDFGPDTFDAGVEFWRAVTATALSPARGDAGQFATLLPETGDPFVRVQRTGDGSNGVHVDLHVDSIVDARDRAVGLGAELVAEPGYAVMRSPGGVVFCLVGHRGEDSVPPAVPSPAPHALDQVCLDIAPDDFERETAFWQQLTGWAGHASTLAEFHALERPAGMPLRFLLQRLDERADRADPGHPRVHLDIACGDEIDAVAAHHVRLGATRIGPVKRWMQMCDPAGLTYCLTPRTPR